MVLFTYVLCESLYGGSLAEKMLHQYMVAKILLKNLFSWNWIAKL